MADFSLTTLFVVPVTQTTLPSTGSTQDLTAGQLGFFGPTYATTDAGGIAALNYFYVAQGRENTYLQGSKRSDKIKGCPTANCKSNVVDFYKVSGCPSPINQITEISDFHVKCGDLVTVTLRAFSSYLNTLYFNGLTRSVTVQAPCCECDGDPCTDVDVPTLIDSIIEALNKSYSNPYYAPANGINPDNIKLSDFFTFTRIGADADAVLRIEGKALTTYGVPCDVAAFPYEYDRLWFRAFAYSGPATTADFIVYDACNVIADVTTIQNSSFAKGLPAEIKQLEKDLYSTQAGYLKHLYRMVGYNQNFESYVSDAVASYNTYYIRFREYDAPSQQNWGDFVPIDETVIIAVEASSAADTAIAAVLAAALGTIPDDAVCLTTTTTTTAEVTTTTTSTTAEEIIG